MNNFFFILGKILYFFDLVKEILKFCFGKRLVKLEKIFGFILNFFKWKWKLIFLVFFFSKLSFIRRLFIV